MLALHGTGVSSGISIGKAHILWWERPVIPEYLLPGNLVEREIERLVGALDAAQQQLEYIREHIPEGAPKETVSFIDAHLLILQDSMISKDPIDTIRKERTNAEWALKLQSEILGNMFDQIDDFYIRSKKSDVNQVVDRILKNLLGVEDPVHTDIEKGDIIVANDLTPADTVLFKHNRIGAFITNFGGPISHTAILARSLQIPAIVSVHNATRLIRKNQVVIIDGKRGAVIVNPDESIISEYKKKQRFIIERRKDLDKLRRSRSITTDRKKVVLMANIELPSDVKQAKKASASSIGLYRTEFLFMNRRQPPSEDEQYREYSKVVRAMEKKPVTIRTMDLGADKQVDGKSRNESIGANPALGLRAVRLCLQSTELFKPQLRAILRASAHGKVRIMIPMITSIDELLQVKDLIEETKQALKKEGKSFSSSIPIGGMIEVPAAAISADLFAPHLDFLSIGTNDLIQYTLAIDRLDDAVSYLYDPVHPSILRLIATVIEAGKTAGIPVSMCGEMAGDARYTRLLLGMGLAEFSMHPSSILGIKKIVRNSSISSLKRFARKILGLRDTRELQTMIDDTNEKYSDTDVH